MENDHFNIGDLVWIKRKKKVAVRGHKQLIVETGLNLPWPGKIVEPPPNASTRSLKRKKYWVFLFGYKHYVWVSKHRVEAFCMSRNNCALSPRPIYRKALAAAQDYRDGISRSDSDDCFDDDDDDVCCSGLTSDEIDDVDFDMGPDIHPDDENPALLSSSTDFGYRKRNYFVEKKGQIRVHCKLPNMMVITREPNPFPEAALVVIEPLDPVVKCGTRIKLQYSEVPRGSSKRKHSYSENDAQSSSKKRCLSGLEVAIPQYILGVVGCGALGTHVSLSLRGTGQPLYIHDSFKPKCLMLENIGAVYLPKASDIYALCDITFCCLTSIDEAKHMIFSSPHGVYPRVIEGKKVVIFTSMDHQSSGDIAEILCQNGGKFLEAPVFCPALHSSDVNENFFLITAGHNQLFNDLKFYLNCITPLTFYVGSAGKATKLCNILNSLMGSIILNLIEIIRLGVLLGLFNDEQSICDFIHILHTSPLIENFINLKKDDIYNIIYDRWPLKTSAAHIKKSMDSVVLMAHETGVSLPVISAASEAIVSAR